MNSRRQSASELAFCERWRQWLRLAGTPAGWREFESQCNGRRAPRISVSAEDVPVLFSVKIANAAHQNQYYPAAVVPARLTEQSTDGSIQRFAMRSNGPFHQSVLLALRWAQDHFGPPATGLALCLDGSDVVPLSDSGLPVLEDESAGLAILMAASWHLRGLQSSQRVAFTGRLEENSRWVRAVANAEGKTRAAKRAGVAWTLTPAAPARSRLRTGTQSSLRLIEIEEAPWLEWLLRAEDELAQRGVSLEPAIGLWQSWLRHLDGLRRGRSLREATKMAERLAGLSSSVGQDSGDTRWTDILFRIQWDVATLALHLGDPQGAARTLRGCIDLSARHRLGLRSIEATRLSAGRLQVAIDLGDRRPSPGILRHLQHVAQSRYTDVEARLSALGALAEWELYSWGWHHRGPDARLATAERCLLQKRRLEEQEERVTGDRLLRSDGQLATLRSLAGRWGEVPNTLSRVLQFDARGLGQASAADRSNWRYQAFYAARWLAHRRLLGEPLSSEWTAWWRVAQPVLRREVIVNRELHLEFGLRRSLLMLDGLQRWTRGTQRQMTTAFERLQRGAALYESDFLVAWSFAAALAWLGHRWGVEWRTAWATHRSACLDHLGWHRRYRELRHLDTWLEHRASASDRRGVGLQAILGVILY
ncbi:MAG: hypothetical protein HY727_07870 [Candidatus Rokubacteria bacterium]|nr:hypothetical protein [Candidatus Rokubacteria bacterium]